MTEIQLVAAEMHKQLACSLGGRVLDEYETEDGFRVVTVDVPIENMSEYREKAALISSTITALRRQRETNQATIDDTIAYLDFND